MACRRGEIYLVDFNPAKGGEMGKLRPAAVVSTDIDNEHLATAVVVPFSTRIVPDAYPYRLFIPKREGLERDSDACIYEIRALSKRRLKKRIAALEPAELAKMQRAICALFGVGDA